MSTPTRALLCYFDARHQAKLGTRAIILPGKDAKLIAALCATQGEDGTKLLIDEFFTSRDPWIESHGYTVGQLVLQAAKLIARRPRLRKVTDWRAECAHEPTCPNVHFHSAKQDAETRTP